MSDEAQDNEDEDELNDEERFWMGIEPLCIGSLPALQQEVKEDRVNEEEVFSLILSLPNSGHDIVQHKR